MKVTKKQKQLKLTCFQGGEILHQISLDKKKWLIGKSSCADIKIDDPYSSHYHAFLIMDEMGGTLIDLASENGSFINNEPVERSFFSSGDILRFGELEFHVQETQDQIQALSLPEEEVALLTHKPKVELPPLPGLVVIDGEYCNIKFDEREFETLQELPVNSAFIHTDAYIEQEPKDEKVFAIKRQSKKQALEVSVITNGVILSIDFLELKNKKYYASPNHHRKNTVHIPVLNTDADGPFFQIKDQKINMFTLKDFVCRNITSGQEINLNDGQSVLIDPKNLYSFHKGNTQVMVRVVEAPSSLRIAPFFGRDRKAQMQMARVFGALMSFTLLLLLIDTTIENPQKELAIIYREAIKAPEPSLHKTSEIASEKDLETGIKHEHQSPEPPKMAKKTAKAKPKASAAKEQSAAPETKAQIAAETKTYQFQMSNVASTMLKQKVTNNAAQINTQAATTMEGSRFLASTHSDETTLSAAQKVEIGTLGKDFAGDYDTSTGTRGLAAKKGIDTSYIDPKTVVLGSMDPELLRRILQEYLPQFRHCYQQELERQGELLQGIVDLNFRITAEGRVARVDIKTKKAEFTSNGVNCMAGVLKMIDFPKPKGGGIVDVRQPLNFSSAKSRL